MTIIKNLKNLILKSGLHRKEQLTILFTVICFALSGLFLPSLKKDLSLESEQVSVKSDVKDNAKKKTSEKAGKNICKTPLVTEDTSQAEENTNKTNSEEATDASDSTDETNDAAQSSNSEEQKNADVSTPSQNQNSASAPAASGSSSAQPSQGGSSSSTTPSTPAAPAKVWVPPVYKTVHHDAVYQTVKVVICNYCGAEFGSTGEFQVHKDANGG